MVFLSLVDTGVTDTGWENITALTQLEGLTLPSAITDAGLKHVAGLMNLSELSFVGMENLKGPGLKELKRLEKLHALDLTETGVDDDGLESLKELSHLKELTLPRRITDAGLARLKGMIQLTRLSVSSPQVTDTGMGQLKGLTNLETLTLTGTKLTDKGLAELKGLTKLKFPR
jgi:Leucine-rich repeat (LRR) protein